MLLKRKIISSIALVGLFAGVTTFAIASPRATGDDTDYVLKNGRVLNTSNQSVSQLEFDKTYTLKFDVSNLPPVPFIKTFGGSSNEHFEKHILTSDGGFVAVGRSTSYDRDMSGMDYGGQDAIIVKYNYRGDVMWKESYGGSTNDMFYHAVEKSNGNIVAGGISDSECILVEYDKNGNYIRRKVFYNGYGANNRILYMEIDSSGNIFLAMEQHPYGSPSANGMIVKINSNLNEIWRTVFDTDGMSNAYGLTVASNGDVFICGRFSDSSGFFANMPKAGGVNDAFIARLRGSDGYVKWATHFDGEDNDDCRQVVENSDGSLLLIGRSTSTRLAGYSLGRGEQDGYMAKLTSTGRITSIRSIGGAGYDNTRYLTKTSDGGYLISGDTNRAHGDFSSLTIRGEGDALWMKLDRNANIEWIGTVAGSGADATQAGMQLPDGGFIISGETKSNDYMFRGLNKGGQDAFIARLNKYGNLDIIGHDETISRIEYEMEFVSSEGNEIFQLDTYFNQYVAMDSTKSYSVNFTLPRNKNITQVIIRARIIDNEDFDISNNYIELRYSVKSSNLSPSLDITTDNINPTNKHVTVTLQAFDKNGIDHIVKPDGSKVYADSVTETLSKNGLLSFIAVNNKGDISVGYIEVTNIDTDKPKVILTKNPTKEWVNKNVVVTATATD